jgi:hypothetical protein
LAFAARLKLSAAERDRLAALRAGPTPVPSSEEAELKRMLADSPADILIGRAWLAGDGGADWAELRSRIASVQPPVFPIGGRDVLTLGVPPGPRVGQLLREVRAWWLEGGCRADAEACRAQLARRLRG